MEPESRANGGSKGSSQRICLISCIPLPAGQAVQALTMHEMQNMSRRMQVPRTGHILRRRNQLRKRSGLATLQLAGACRTRMRAASAQSSWLKPYDKICKLLKPAFWSQPRFARSRRRSIWSDDDVKETKSCWTLVFDDSQRKPEDPHCQMIHPRSYFNQFVLALTTCSLL
jgi:hypothetical protein